MELGAVDVSAAHHAGDGHAAIPGDTQGALRAVLGIEAVDIVDVLPVLEIPEQRVRLRLWHGRRFVRYREPVL